MVWYDLCALIVEFPWFLIGVGIFVAVCDCG